MLRSKWQGSFQANETASVPRRDNKRPFTTFPRKQSNNSLLAYSLEAIINCLSHFVEE